jgi:hypothetical protein
MFMLSLTEICGQTFVQGKYPYGVTTIFNSNKNEYWGNSKTIPKISSRQCFCKSQTDIVSKINQGKCTYGIIAIIIIMQRRIDVRKSSKRFVFIIII